MTVRVALVLDRDRRGEEEIALSRLAVGLAADGVRPALVLSPTQDQDGRESPRPVDGPIPCLEAPTNPANWLRRRLSTALLDRLEESGFGRPDVIVGCGRGAFHLAATMADQLEVPLVAEVRDRRDVDAACRFPAVTVIAATEALRAGAARRIGDERATDLPVPVPRTRPDEDRDRGLVIALGPTQELNAWKAMIDGISGPGGPPAGLRHLAFGLGDTRKDAVIWSRLRNSPLAGRMSSFDHTDRMRPLLCGADVILAPDRDRPVRSIEMQARISGGVVICSEDAPRSDRRADIGDRVLAPGEARRPGAWREAIETALADAPSPASAASAKTSLVSRVAPRWAAALETIVRGDATPIDAA